MYFIYHSRLHPTLFKLRYSQVFYSGDRVYLSANTERWGWELFWIDDSVPTTIASIEGMIASDQINTPEEVFPPGYPNPFTAEFILRINGKKGELFDMNVVSMDGRKDHYSMEYNTDHVLGKSWNPGLYILQIYNGERLVTHKMVKQ